MPKFHVTEVSPEDGATILACAHIMDHPEHGHFYGLPEEIMFSRPDGSKGISKWFIVCPDCHEKCDGSPLPFIAADYSWIGGEPVAVRKVTQ